MDTGKYGIGTIGMGGTYSGDPSDWYMIYEGSLISEGPSPIGDFGAIAYGSIWGNDGNIQSVIKGRTFGYYSDLSKDTPTGIFVGETVGTFNPSAKTWQTVTVGTFIETKTYLNNLGKLGAIGVPVAEIGTVTLSGNKNCDENCIRSVTLTDVKFLAPSTGQPPCVFATNSLSGTYNGTPTNDSITLSGGSIQNLKFEVNYWDNNKWSAKIFPDTAFQGRIDSYTIKDMRGIAAGTYNGGNFSGTAAGIVRASMAPGTVGSSQ